jgi:hypothetical protein
MGCQGAEKRPFRNALMLYQPSMPPHQLGNSIISETCDFFGELLRAKEWWAEEGIDQFVEEYDLAMQPARGCLWRSLRRHSHLLAMTSCELVLCQCAYLGMVGTAIGFYVVAVSK